MSLTNFLLKSAANKVLKVVKGENSVEKNYSRTVANVTKTVTNASKQIENAVHTVKKISGEISSTSEVVSFQKEIKNLRAEGKITQDILDAILCENKNKLALAYREAIRAEAVGKPLKYLSEDEVDEALGFRTRITKALTHKFARKN